MIKKVLLGLVILFLIIAIYLFFNHEVISINFSKMLFYNDGYDVHNLPDKLVEKDLPLFEGGPMHEIVGFAGQDLGSKDLREISKEYLANFTFDQNTKWPEKSKLPEGFNPEKIFEMCKDPGLEVKELHEKGITGKGISVAVFDKPIFSSHQEFQDRMNYIRIAPEDEKKFKYHFHGIMCVSILAGKICGVAPDAEIYYFACPDNDIEHSYYYSKAINKVIEINNSLPDEKKIRVISISDSFDLRYKDALEKAEKEGITVIYSNFLGIRNFLWGGASPFKDKDDPMNYEYADYCIENNVVREDSIMIPGNYRTVASNIGKDGYLYNADGGFSSAIPYVVGLAALAWQVNEDLTINEIINLLHETKTRLPGNNVVNPSEFINRVKLEVK